MHPTTTREGGAPDFTTAHPCPSYCRLPVGHHVDSIHGELDDVEALHSRAHSGPQFGDLLAGGAVEFTAEPGAFEASVTLRVGAAASLDFADPLDLRLLAHHAVRAADWLEAQA